MPRLLNALRDELISAGLVRKPAIAGPLPPMWLARKMGTPGPGEGANPVEVGDTLVANAYMTGGLAPPAFGQWATYPNVELRLRSSDGYQAEDLEAAITLRLLTRWAGGLSTAPPLLGGSLSVVEVQQAIPLQLLSSGDQGFEHMTTYAFELYRPGA
jgi:hypothetical protein